MSSYTMQLQSVVAYVVAAGAIELSIFSEYYKTELDVVDIQTQRVDRFGKLLQ